MSLSDALLVHRFSQLIKEANSNIGALFLFRDWKYVILRLAVVRHNCRRRSANVRSLRWLPALGRHGQQASCAGIMQCCPYGPARVSAIYIVIIMRSESISRNVGDLHGSSLQLIGIWYGSSAVCCRYVIHCNRKVYVYTSGHRGAAGFAKSEPPSNDQHEQTLQCVDYGMDVVVFATGDTEYAGDHGGTIILDMDGHGWTFAHARATTMSTSLSSNSWRWK